MSEPSYLFGDTDLAAERLRLVAEVFEPEMRSFLARVEFRPRLAVDLGCGPGHTTRLTAQVLRPDRTVGIDTSSRFIEMARAEPADGVDYFEHDVTNTPFPVGPADLMFCHLLLPHLRDPATALGMWATQLAPRGLLLVDDVANIRTAQPVFRRYLDMVETVIETGDGQLYAGNALKRLNSIPGLDMVSSRQVELPVSASDAAAMFRLNVAVWGRTPSTQAIVPPARIAEMESELDTLIASTSRHEIAWDMRQVAYEASPLR